VTAASPNGPPVFTIPPGLPFLDTLAEALLSGRLVGDLAGGPFGLAAVTLYLPTRRAARALAAILARVSRKGSPGGMVKTWPSRLTEGFSRGPLVLPLVLPAEPGLRRLPRRPRLRGGRQRRHPRRDEDRALPVR
jgi:hypothetical protein